VNTHLLRITLILSTGFAVALVFTVTER